MLVVKVRLVGLVPQSVKKWFDEQAKKEGRQPGNLAAKVLIDYADEQKKQEKDDDTRTDRT